MPPVPPEIDGGKDPVLIATATGGATARGPVDLDAQGTLGAHSVAKDGDRFSFHAAALARELFGEPNKSLSSGDELRFGRQGSKSVDTKTGQFFDHEQGVGGGVLWAVEHYAGAPVAGGLAVEWLRDHGYYVEDAALPPPGGGSGARLDPDGNFLPNRVPDNGRLTATYDYTDETGALSYQVCRYDWPDPASPKGHSKTFVQRRPDPDKRHGWAYTVKGLTWLPYRLPELIADIRAGYDVFLVEGEKKVDMLRAEGIPATCNHGGAGKFPADLARWFEGAKVIILPDNDQPGRDHADLIARRLDGVAKSCRVLELPGLPDKGGVDDWLPAGGSAEALYDLVEQGAKVATPTFNSVFGAVQWADLDAPGPTYDWLVKSILTANEVSFLLGESQSGKSFLAIDLALSVARGIDWFGHRSRKSGVIYQAGESATGVRRRRLPAYRAAFDVAREAVPFTLLQRPLDLYTSDEQVEAFIDECRYWGGTYDVPLGLIVIDTFNKATPGANENDGKDMGAVLARCDRIRRETGAHVMLVHHLNAGGTKARGHTSLFGNVENVVTVRKVPDSRDGDKRPLREWTLSKAKDAEDGASEKFVLRGVHLGTDEDGDSITSCVIAPPTPVEGASGGDDDKGGVFITGFNATILRAVYDTIKTRGVLAPQELGLSRGWMAVEKSTLQAEIKARLEAGEPAPEPGPGETLEQAQARARETRRKAIQRAREFLYQKKVIGQRDGWTWLTGRDVKGFEPAPGTARGEDDRPRRRSTMIADDGSEIDLPFDAPDDGGLPAVEVNDGDF